MPLLISPKQSKRRQGLSTIKLRRRSLTSRGISKARPDDECSAMHHCLTDRQSRVKRVAFAEDYHLPCIDLDENNTLSDEECRRRWYQNNDYTRFQKDRVLTSFEYKAALNKTHFNEDEQSIRGIEAVVNDRLRRRVNGEKKDLLKAVKAEEDHQKDVGTFPDMSKFRSVCIRHTKAARDRAISLAAEDAKAINGKAKSWLSRRLPFGDPERTVTRHRSLG